MDDATTVKALLDSAGIHPPEEDVVALVQAYQRSRRMSALLFAVEEARYESPALGFRADPQYRAWW